MISRLIELAIEAGDLIGQQPHLMSRFLAQLRASAYPGRTITAKVMAMFAACGNRPHTVAEVAETVHCSEVTVRCILNVRNKSAFERVGKRGGRILWRRRPC